MFKVQRIRLKNKADFRLSGGHPWVYSNEIQGSLKSYTQGSLVEIEKASGEALAHGYFNVHSLISFRKLGEGRWPNANQESELSSASLSQYLKQKLLEAFSLRHYWIAAQDSHRAVFGESDFVPGLVIDRYFVQNETSMSGHWVFVLQVHTHGIEALLEPLLRALSELAPDQKIIVRRDMSVRKLEGLSDLPSQIYLNAKKLPDQDLYLYQKAMIRVSSRWYWANLVDGQKTGFFLDQKQNIARFVQGSLQYLDSNPKETIKILDLCCFMGQWSQGFCQEWLKKSKVEVVLFDASEDALELALKSYQKNFETQINRGQLKIRTVKGDVLKDLNLILNDNSKFDIVIADPPAFIKSKKDIGPGAHAYFQLFSSALSLTGLKGIVVLCSCSAHLGRTEMLEVMRKSIKRSKTKVSWVDEGGHGPDHPMLAEFLEGFYLKAFMGVVREKT